MNNDKNTLFTDAPVKNAVLTLAIPTVISQLITVVYNMADTFFIGQLNDPLQVAAATIRSILHLDGNSSFVSIWNSYYAVGTGFVSDTGSKGRNMGISGIAWATPFADWIAFAISLVLIIPCLVKLGGAGNTIWKRLRLK